MADVDLPGRLGDPDRALGDDPRLDPRWGAALATFGLDGVGEPPPVSIEDGRDAILAFVNAAEAGFQALFDALFAGLPAVEGVERETLTIPGDDGNEITLYVHRPAGSTGPEPLPCVYHTHGGGMVLLQASDVEYVRWRDELAATGLVVVGVEFRNGGGALGPHPYPAGLNDCVAGLRYVIDHRDELGVGAIVISGESGGGNLAIATTLTAKAQGWVDEIAGVYAQCPYISGRYGNPPPELVSLVENDTYFLRGDMMRVLVEAYDPGGEHAQEITCWPWHATADDLGGMPPHVVSVNELDPLRDEGLAYLHTLWAAGVTARGRIVAGTTHAGDLLGRVPIPDVQAASLADLCQFVATVSA